MSFAQQRAQFHPLTQDVTERMSVTPAKVSPTAPPTKKWQQLLSDPGKPGVRSLGPDVRPSPTKKWQQFKKKNDSWIDQVEYIENF